MNDLDRVKGQLAEATTKRNAYWRWYFSGLRRLSRWPTWKRKILSWRFRSLDKRVKDRHTNFAIHAKITDHLVYYVKRLGG
jgi:hypothetical protein